VAKALLANGANANARDKYNSTPLMYASGNNNAEVVKVLIKYNADKDAVPNGGNTALKYAQSNGYTSIVDLLQGKR
jgi:ankyrin repeat protein